MTQEELVLFSRRSHKDDEPCQDHCNRGEKEKGLPCEICEQTCTPWFWIGYNSQFSLNEQSRQSNTLFFIWVNFRRSFIFCAGKNVEKSNSNYSDPSAKSARKIPWLESTVSGIARSIWVTRAHIKRIAESAGHRLMRSLTWIECTPIILTCTNYDLELRIEVR